jgi:hypothetical protein
MNTGSNCLLLSVALVACFGVSCNIPVGDALRPYKYVSAEPARAEIVGTWTPDQATVDDMRARGGYDVSAPTQLVLRDDGSLEVANMPDWWDNGFGISHKGLSSGPGRWRLTNASGRWEVGLSYGGTYRPVGLVEHRFRSKPRYYIEIIVGDPDSGDEMIFVKKE